jgi:hypothetical protein
VHHPSRLVGRAGGFVLAVALAMPASGCSKSEPSAPAAPVVPTLTSISPTSGVRGTTVLMTLTGTNFVVGLTQVATGGGYLLGADVISENSTSITKNIIISPAAPLGDVLVEVTTGLAHSEALAFTVLPPAPTLTNMTPSIGAQGATVAVTLTGTNFLAGATTVDVAGTGVTTNSVATSGSSSLTANFVIAADATLGARAVTVTTAGGTSASEPFTVQSPPLTNRAPQRL